MKRLSILTLFLLVLSGCQQDTKSTTFELEKLAAKVKAESDRTEMEIKILKVQTARLHFGDDFANRFERCLFDPPKQPQNQKACSQLQKRFDDYSARLEAERKKW